MAAKKSRKVGLVQLAVLLNPDQVFVVQSMTRRCVAERFNEIIENDSLSIPEFKPDDARLTDEVCQAVADGSNDAIAQVDEVVDQEYQLHHCYLVAEFGSEQDKKSLAEEGDEEKEE